MPAEKMILTKEMCGALPLSNCKSFLKYRNVALFFDECLAGAMSQIIFAPLSLTHDS